LLRYKSIIGILGRVATPERLFASDGTGRQRGAQAAGILDPLIDVTRKGIELKALAFEPLLLQAELLELLT